MARLKTDLRDHPRELHTCSCRLEVSHSYTEVVGVDVAAVSEMLKRMPASLRRSTLLALASAPRRTTVTKLRARGPSERSKGRSERLAAAAEVATLGRAVISPNAHASYAAVATKLRAQLEETAELVEDVDSVTDEAKPLGSRVHTTIVAECPQHVGWSAFGELYGQRATFLCGCKWDELIPYAIEHRDKRLGVCVVNVCTAHESIALDDLVSVVSSQV